MSSVLHFVLHNSVSCCIIKITNTYYCNYMHMETPAITGFPQNAEYSGELLHRFKSGCRHLITLDEQSGVFFTKEKNMKIKQDSKLLQKTGVVCLLACICCLLWGSAFPCIKIGYKLFAIDAGDTMTQILFAGIRFTLAGLFTILIGSIPGKKLLKPTKEAVPDIVKLCLFQTVLQYLFFYVGLAHTSGVKASIIEASNVFLAIIVASLIFRQEKLTVKKMAGCLIGFAGVVLINLNGGSVDMSMKLTGEGFIFFSTIAYAISSVLLKKYSAHSNPVLLSGYQFLLGGIIMTVCGLIAGGRIQTVTAGGMGMLLYLALVSAVAYSVWGILLKNNPVSRVTVFGFANPVFGVLLSAILLQEGSQVLNISALAALVLVCVGIYTVNA